MKHAKLLGVFAASAVLVACSLNINGVFTASTDLTFVKKGFFGDREINVSQGSYRATASFGDNNVTLELQTQGNRKVSVKFKAPSSSFPTDGSWVRVPSSQTEQPYDLLASALKEVTVDPRVYREWESCSVQRCYTHCDPQGRCWRECRSYPGDRPVEYRLVYTDWDIDTRLLGQRDQVVGRFAGERQIVERDYIHYGACR